MPKISVIMPVYNSERYLAEAIQSILTQTYSDFEFIIVNDACTDSSVQIIDAFCRKDSRIRVINNERNMNIALSRNIGVEKALGDFVVTMDSDDIALTDRLLNQLTYLESNPEVDICIGDIHVIDEVGTYQYTRKYPITDKELKSKIYRFNPFPNPTIMCRKSVYTQVGKYDNAFVPIDDFEFWIRAGVTHKFGNCAVPVLNYRIVKKSASHGKVRKTEWLTFLVRKKAYALGYPCKVPDLIFNVVHLIVFYTLPASLKIRMFNLLRRTGALK